MKAPKELEAHALAEDGKPGEPPENKPASREQQLAASLVTERTARIRVIEENIALEEALHKSHAELVKAKKEILRLISIHVNSMNSSIWKECGLEADESVTNESGEWLVKKAGKAG